MTCTKAAMTIAWSLILLTAIFVVFIVQADSQNTEENDTLSNLRPIHNEIKNPGLENNVDPSLLWSDEFDGDELNQQHWSYDSTKSLLEQQEEYSNEIEADIKLDPVNTEFEFYDSHAVFVKDGMLTISTQQVINAGVPFVSGRIKTQDKVLFQYGTIEARIRIRSSCEPGVEVCVSSRNLSPSFWTRGSGSTSFGEPIMGQVDIFTAAIPKPSTRARTLQSTNASGSFSSTDEHQGVPLSTPTQSRHIDNQSSHLRANQNGFEKGAVSDHSWNGHSGATWIASVSSNNGHERLIRKSLHNDYPIENWMDQDFQIYKFDWTPTRLATYIDEELVWEMDITNGSCGDCQNFHRPHYLLLAIAVLDSPSWPLSSTSTLDLTVDHIRLLDNGFAKLSMQGETRRQ